MKLQGRAYLNRFAFDTRFLDKYLAPIQLPLQLSRHSCVLCGIVCCLGVTLGLVDKYVWPAKAVLIEVMRNEGGLTFPAHARESSRTESTRRIFAQKLFQDYYYNISTLYHVESEYRQRAMNRHGYTRRWLVLEIILTWEKRVLQPTLSTKVDVMRQGGSGVRPSGVPDGGSLVVLPLPPFPPLVLESRAFLAPPLLLLSFFPPLAIGPSVPRPHGRSSACTSRLSSISGLTIGRALRLLYFLNRLQLSTQNLAN